MSKKRHGFFSTEEDTTTLADGGCGYSCTLNQGCRSPKMPPTGEGREGVLIVAEAPGAQEDQDGTQLVGKIGQFFRSTLQSLGIDLGRDCRKTNAVRCRPPENRTPTPQEIQACREHVRAEIRTSRPRVVIPLGAVALESLIGDAWTKDSLGGIGRWRGFCIPDHRFGAWVCPTWHPSYVARMRNDTKGSAVEPIFREDLRQAFALRQDQPLPPPVTEEEIRYVVDRPDLLLRDPQNLPPGGVYSVDFETTGLKPHRAGHQIVCAAISDGTRTWAFPVGEDRRTKTALGRFLRNPGYRKVAAHLQFEALWSSVCLGADPQGWEWDTMLAAHVLDNRPGVTGLKFQAFVELGLVGYDGGIVFAKSKDANAFNGIEKVPMSALLRYCALDALATHRLYQLQKGRLHEC